MFGNLFLGLALATFFVWSETVSCDDQRVQINLKKPLHTVAEEFVSFSVRASDLRQLEDEAE